MNVTFAERVLEEATKAGLRASVLQTFPESYAFGDTMVLLGVPPLVLRVVRDRGQELVRFSADPTPVSFRIFADLDQAFRWRTMEEITLNACFLIQKGIRCNHWG
jgi:hypothetical protein